jgi:hypothetical protein
MFPHQTKVSYITLGMKFSKINTKNAHLQLNLALLFSQ